MTSTSEPTAPFPTRSTITSLWTARRSRLAPSLASQGPTATTTTTKSEPRSAAKVNGARHQEAARKARDEEAETWGAEASMGIGAGRPVKSEDKESELRGRILGKRRREVDEKGKGKGEEKGKGGTVGGSDSEEEVGRSALGRKKKRRVDVRPSGPAKEAACVAEARGGPAGAEVKQGDEAAVGAQAEEVVKGGEEEGGGGKGSPADNSPAESTKPKRKKKNKKKKKAAE